MIIYKILYSAYIALKAYGIANFANGLFLRSDERVCVTLDLTDETYPGWLKITGVDGKPVFEVVDVDKYVIGDVGFGNILSDGDCSYAFRQVILDKTMLSEKVVKVRTVDPDDYNLVEEYVERVPNSGIYIPLKRETVNLNMDDAVVPETIDVAYDLDSRTTTYSVKEKLNNDFCIGSVVIGRSSFHNFPCLSRTVIKWVRYDGRRSVMIKSNMDDETVDTVLFVERETNSNRFNKYGTGIDDVAVWEHIVDDMDFRIPDIFSAA